MVIYIFYVPQLYENLHFATQCIYTPFTILRKKKFITYLHIINRSVFVIEMDILRARNCINEYLYTQYFA